MRPLAKLIRILRFSRALLVDKRTPAAAKWFAAIAVIYVLSPIDLLPDFLPVIGQIDDVIVVAFCLHLLLRAIPDELLQELEQGRGVLITPTRA